MKPSCHAALQQIYAQIAESTQMPNHERSKFLALEVGRGLAAVIVVLYHIDKYYFDNPKYWHQPLLEGIFSFGHAGVEFFFVLSGFVMIWAHYDDLGRVGAVKSFITKRAIRIYPLVFLTVGLITIMYFLEPGSGKPEYRDPLVILQSLFLVGSEPMNALNFPTWTLWHENLFYVFCVATIAKPRLGLCALGLWTFACLISALIAGSSADIFYMLRPTNCLFALGVGVALFLRKRSLPFAWPILLGGIIGFFAYGVFSVGRALPEYLSIATFGGFSTLIIIGATELERSGRLVMSRKSSLLGTLSYPLYLSHMISLPVVAAIANRMNLTGSLSPIPAAICLLASAVVVAFFVHYAFERPTGRWLRAKLATRRHQEPRTAQGLSSAAGKPSSKPN